MRQLLKVCLIRDGGRCCGFEGGPAVGLKTELEDGTRERGDHRSNWMQGYGRPRRPPETPRGVSMSGEPEAFLPANGVRRGIHTLHGGGFSDLQRNHFLQGHVTLEGKILGPSVSGVHLPYRKVRPSRSHKRQIWQLTLIGPRTSKSCLLA